MTDQRAKWREIAVILAIIVLASAAVGALLGLYGERLGIGSVTRAAVIAGVVVVAGGVARAFVVPRLKGPDQSRTQ